METSTLITVVYFSANIALLLLSSIYIIIKGGLHGVKLLGKDVWALKKIYGPMIVHFYDCATDLGVVYYWYTLMEEEQNGTYDYDSVDMEIYFWCGITFLILYRVVMFVYLVLEYFGLNFAGEKGKWFDPLLLLLHLYVFRAAYLSYKDNKEAIEKRKQAKDSNSTSAGSDPGSGSTTNVTPKVKELDIEINTMQNDSLILESGFESLPQIILQSVFIIRSYNDEKLRTDSIWLLGISIIASLMSISDKFVKVDEEADDFMAESPKFEDVSKGLCLNKETLWYSVRVLWRTCHIANGFVVYVLIWTVLGGAFLPIWSTVVLVSYITVHVLTKKSYQWWEHVMMPFANMGATVVFDLSTKYLLFARWGQVLIGLTVIAIFATNEFECGICADSLDRTFNNEDESGVTNHRIAIFYMFGCVAFLLDLLLMFVMTKGDQVKNLWD